MTNNYMYNYASIEIDKEVYTNLQIEVIELDLTQRPVNIYSLPHKI